MGQPIVSVGLPVYNGARHLPAAVESVLGQTLEDFELIINDNGSTDETPDVCRRYAARDCRVKFHRAEANRGLAWNFNRVFELARGRYFKWTAHDDIMLPAYLQRCVETLEANPDAVMTYPRRRFIVHDQVIDAAGAWLDASLADRIESHGDRISYQRLLELPGYFHPTFIHGLIRPDALRRTRGLGGFPCSDMVLSAELRLQGPFVEIPETLFYQRHHGPEPAWKSRKTLRGEAAYMDPAADHRFMLPGIKVWLEHLRAVRHAHLQPREAREAYVSIARTMLMKVKIAARQKRLWSRVAGEVTGKIPKAPRTAA